MTIEGAFSQLIVKTNSNPKFDMGLVCRFSSLERINDDNNNQYELNKLVITWSSFNAVVLDNNSSTQHSLDWRRRGRHVSRSAWHKSRPVGEEWYGSDHKRNRWHSGNISEALTSSHNLMHMGQLLRLRYLERFLNNSWKSNSVQSYHSDQSQEEINILAITCNLHKV